VPHPRISTGSPLPSLPFKHTSAFMAKVEPFSTCQFPEGLHNLTRSLRHAPFAYTSIRDDYDDDSYAQILHEHHATPDWTHAILYLCFPKAPSDTSVNVSISSASIDFGALTMSAAFGVDKDMV
jgi:hypothetical protein